MTGYELTSIAGMSGIFRVRVDLGTGRSGYELTRSRLGYIVFHTVTGGFASDPVLPWVVVP